MNYLKHYKNNLSKVSVFDYNFYRNINVLSALPRNDDYIKHYNVNNCTSPINIYEYIEHILYDIMYNELLNEEINIFVNTKDSTDSTESLESKDSPDSPKESKDTKNIAHLISLKYLSDLHNLRELRNLKTVSNISNAQDRPKLKNTQIINKKDTQIINKKDRQLINENIQKPINRRLDYGFSWKDYVKINSLNITTEIDAINHYNNVGKELGLKYRYNMSSLKIKAIDQNVLKLQKSIECGFADVPKKSSYNNNKNNNNDFLKIPKISINVPLLQVIQKKNPRDTFNKPIKHIKSIKLPITRIDRNTNIYNIPKIIHFIYGLSYQEDRQFEFFKYNAIYSAYDHNKEYKIIIHVPSDNIPESVWWDKLKEIPTLSFCFIESSCFTEQKEAYINGDHWSHKSDYMRLIILEKYGGVYIDIDTITFKSLDEIIDNKKSFVIGRRNNNDKYLHNAIIASTIHNKHIQKWIDKYTVTNIWNYNSLILPYKLFGMVKHQDIRIVTGNKICSTHWSTVNEKIMSFDTKDTKDTICMHLWESSSILLLNSDMYKRLCLHTRA